MIDPDDVDRHLEMLLECLGKIQRKDGSFDTRYFRTDRTEGWKSWPENACYDTATALLPLLFLRSVKSEPILEKGCRYLQKRALSRKIWGYPALSNDYVLPYDIGSTALSSFILSKKGYEINNKSFLDTLINAEGNYHLFIPPKRHEQISLITYLKIKRRADRSTFQGITKRESEFSENCNVLLYTGMTMANSRVWEQVISSFADQKIDYIYYDAFYAIYSYSRLLNYGEHRSPRPPDKVVDDYISTLCQLTVAERFSLSRVLLANTLLHFGYVSNPHFDSLAEYCFSDIFQNRTMEDTALYSFNRRSTRYPDIADPDILFGSPALNISLYSEFLNLYRNRFFGSYYGM